jgi:hypothetical protein
MSTDAQSIDITESTELLALVEEVRRSGVGRLLKRGEQELALLTPVTGRRKAHPPREVAGDEHDTLLDIIGIGASSEPTDIAQREGEYLAEAYSPARRCGWVILDLSAKR